MEISEITRQMEIYLRIEMRNQTAMSSNELFEANDAPPLI